MPRASMPANLAEKLAKCFPSHAHCLFSASSGIHVWPPRTAKSLLRACHGVDCQPNLGRNFALLLAKEQTTNTQATCSDVMWFHSMSVGKPARRCVCVSVSWVSESGVAGQGKTHRTCQHCIYLFLIVIHINTYIHPPIHQSVIFPAHVQHTLPLFAPIENDP